MFFTLLLLFLCKNALAQNIAGRFIVNGEDANQTNYPYSVAIETSFGGLCGGSLLNSKFVLTARHCVCEEEKPIPSAQYNVVYGTSNIESDRRHITVGEKVFCHYSSDIALIKLEKKLPKDGSWKPACLRKDFKPKTEEAGVIIGWGLLSREGQPSAVLQKLNVTVHDKNLCSGIGFAEDIICVSSPVGGACLGDSGSALLVNAELVGVMSFGTDECGTSTPQRPNGYVNILKHLDWIRRITKKVCFC